MNIVANMCSGAVLMSSDFEAGVGLNLIQSSGISYFSLYTFFLKYLHQ